MAQILLLEDNLVFSQLICASLFEEGHEVVACVDATSAYDAFCGQRFDLVIADIIVRKDGQPVPDGGLSLISKVKRLCKVHNRKVPIIAISGALTIMVWNICWSWQVTWARRRFWPSRLPRIN